MSGDRLRIFHISNDYPYTSVYPDILTGLHKLGCGRQMMYVPVHKMIKVSNSPYFSENWDVKVSRDYGFFGRFLLERRFEASSKNAIRTCEVKKFNVVHAHYLFSGGGVARLIKKNTNIPYVCTVRGTDINFYLKMPHLRKLAIKILSGADRVTFLSPSQKTATFSKLGSVEQLESIEKKTRIIPNGISEEWIKNLGSPRSRVEPRSLRLLFVGELTRNKNWKSVVVCQQLLVRRGVPTVLTIAGDGEDRALVVEAARGNPGTEFVGFVTSTDAMIQLYRQSDIFVMPSFSESFGLSYLEAMSQGLPVVYSRNQGIDGFFPDQTIGSGVNPDSPEEMAEAIIRIWENLSQISYRSIEESLAFSWDKVVKSYFDTYVDCLDGPPHSVDTGFPGCLI